jgi:glycosyltransferase involved in cell wall biosynthesis/GT2 family glycosyltransferase
VDAWRERERSLGRLGADVTVLSAQSWDEGGTAVRLVPRPGERVHGVRTWGRHPALFVYDPRPIWRAMGGDWDVVDIHEEPFALATAEVLLIRRLRGQRAPYTLYSAQNLEKRYPPPFRWLERWALGRAAGLNVCNVEAGRIAVAKGLPGRPSLIPLGIDPRGFAPARPTALASGAIRVGYAGRLGAHKGVDVLLAAAADEPRLEVTIAGDGPAAAELREQARSSGLDGRVRFLGPLDAAELPEFYAQLDVLAVPSLPTAGWTEQFGRVAVEAMACAVPVVASASGALPDVVGGAGLLVPPGEPDALRGALVRVGTDPALAARMREDGLARASACTWDRVAQLQLAMYDRALHRPTSGDAPRRLEVVVVAYGSAELLRESLRPLRDLTVTVVDNSSSPEVRQVCVDAGARYLDPGRNGGFAAGVNHALADRLAPDADVLLLNPDAVISPSAVAELHRALRSDPDLASVGPAQVDPDGAPARVAWPFPSPGGTWLEAVGLGRLRTSPDFVIGSALLLRAEALDQLGGLDERFFLYAEETDWAYRATRLGWRHAVVPSAVAMHVGGGTSSDPRRREIHFHASQERFLRKHFGPGGWQLARLGQMAGAAARSVVLPAGRRGAAADRLRQYVRGPVRAEVALRGRLTPPVDRVA